VAAEPLEKTAHQGVLGCGRGPGRNSVEKIQRPKETASKAHLLAATPLTVSSETDLCLCWHCRSRSCPACKNFREELHTFTPARALMEREDG